jgi:hypothetical protein
MPKFSLYTIYGPLYRCIECKAWTSSEEHLCEEQSFVYTEEEFLAIKANEERKINGN